jgi:hypothetical protein
METEVTFVSGDIAVPIGDNGAAGGVAAWRGGCGGDGGFISTGEIISVPEVLFKGERN